MQLFRLDLLYRVLGGVDLDNSIALHETKRLPSNPLGSLSTAFDLIGGAEFIFTLPGFWVPFVHWLWRIPTILASAGVVSREIEDRTWNTLRVTTLSVHEIIMAKYAAVLHYMEPHFMLVLYVRAMPVIIFGVSWIVSTLTVLPQEGFMYWLSTSVAFLTAGLYLLLSPILDTAFDAALGIMISTMTTSRSSALIMAVLARLTGFLLPMALVIPLEYGVFNSLAGLGVIQLRAIAIISTFGPAYAFLWGLEPWFSSLFVVLYAGVKLGLLRAMLAVATSRAARIEI